MIKGIIFDLDGVLLSTDEYHYLAWKALTDKLNIPFNKDISDELRGLSRMDSLNAILSYSNKHYSEEEKEQMAEYKNDIYKTYLENMSPERVSNNVRTTLEELKKRGYKLAVGSSSKNTKLILEKTDLRKYFDAVSDGTNITRAKPDPEVFLLAAKYLHLSPSECVIVEDAISGINAGINGKFKTIGINYASKYDKTDYPINSFEEILDLKFD